MVRLSLAITMLLWTSASVVAQGGGGIRASEIDIEGTYNCLGNPKSENEYRGTTRITKKDEVYIVTWAIGKETHEGTGIRVGDTLSVVWRNDKGEVGVAVYIIRSKGKLEGKWTGLGSRYQSTENLTRDN